MNVVSVVVDFCFFFGGLCGDGDESLSVSEGVGRAESCFCFFCARLSLRLCGVVDTIARKMSLLCGVEVWR